MIDNNQMKAQQYDRNGGYIFKWITYLLSLLLSIDVEINDQIQALWCGLTSTSNNCFCFPNNLPCVMTQEKQTFS